MGDKIDKFNSYRSAMNEKLLNADNLQIKRFFNLDTQAYSDGELSSKTKELLGLAASGVLRCDDCITYHLIKCAKHGVTRQEFLEVFNVILVVGGSITIPHIRRAMEVLEEV
jgi:AhpD family alkylhydroperoxidase